MILGSSLLNTNELVCDRFGWLFSCIKVDEDVDHRDEDLCCDENDD